MKNMKLPINSRFYTAVLFVIGIFAGWVSIVLALLTMGMTEDKWVKKMMVRVIAVVTIWYGLSAMSSGLRAAVSLLSLDYTFVYRIVEVIADLLSLAEYVCMLLMAWKAYNGAVFTFPFLEKVVQRAEMEELQHNLTETYCNVCGEHLNAEDAFCQNCGAKRNE